MIESSSNCSHCGVLKKKEEILTYFENNCKFTLCKKCFDKNIISHNASILDNSACNNSLASQVNIIIKNEDKKLDLNECLNECTKKNDMPSFLYKKRRISKKIVFKRKKTEIKDNFTNALNKLIYISADKNKLIITSKINKNFKNKKCDLCKTTKLIKEKKMLLFKNSNNFISFYDELYNNIEQDENKNYLIKCSQIKYNQIVEQHQIYLQLKKMNEGKEIIFKSNQIICFFCIYEFLMKNNGINLLWDDLLPDDNKRKKLEMISSLENMLINTSKNIDTNINEVQIKEEDNKTDKNISLEDDINFYFNDKKANIFDLILGDEEGDQGDLNDIENDSDEKSSKNKKNNNDNQRINESKKDKKITKGKSKENKITFKKIIGGYNPPNPNSINSINNSNTKKFNNNINQNINFKNTNNNFDLNNKNKNINIINMNNINNINQYNDSNYAQKNTEQIQPLFYNNYFNSTSGQNNPIYNQNIINNIDNNNLGYLNNNYPENAESIYNRLTNQLENLKNKLNLITNLNNSRIAKNNNINNDLQLFISKNIIKDNLFFFQNSMHLILNYMNNISDMLNKFSCINENSLGLMNSMINGTISTDNLMQLKNNSNHFSQLLNYNYNIQKMNTELCDIINNHLYH